MKKISAMKLLKTIKKEYPFSEWIGDEAVLATKPFTPLQETTVFSLYQEPGEDNFTVLAWANIDLPTQFLFHRKAGKFIQKFRDNIARSNNFGVSVEGNTLSVFSGINVEGSDIERCRELSSAVFEVLIYEFTEMSRKMRI